MQASESVVTVCFNSSLLHYGGDIAVGAMTILTSVMQFAMLPLQGIAQGSQPIASYNYGAKNCRQGKENFPSSCNYMLNIFHIALGYSTDYSKSIRKYFYFRRKTGCLYCTNVKNIFGWFIPFRNSNCLSDNIYVPWQSSQLYYCCCCA